MDNLEIADRIKKRCKGMKISVKSLLDDCGINHGFIYDLEHKNSAPSIDKINKIANYLNCSVDYLLGRVDNPLLYFSIFVCACLTRIILPFCLLIFLWCLIGQSL